MGDEGEYDFVAIYDHHPLEGGWTGEGWDERHFVYTDFDDVWTTAKRASNTYYIAYVTTHHALGRFGRLLILKGPIP